MRKGTQKRNRNHPIANVRAVLLAIILLILTLAATAHAAEIYVTDIIANPPLIALESPTITVEIWNDGEPGNFYLFHVIDGLGGYKEYYMPCSSCYGNIVMSNFFLGELFDAGWHTITFCAENCMDRTWEWIAPDLRITDILPPSSTAAGQPFTITARVSNTSSASAGTFNVAMAIDGYYWGESTVSGLAANSSRDVTFSVPGGLSAGMHSIYFYADWGADVNESDETNNDLTEFFTWTAPDLRITDIFSPSSTEAGKPITITARVANSGSASAGTFTVAMAIDGEYWGQLTVSGLAANSSRDVSFSVPGGLSAGMHSIYFYADWGADVNESDETNNDLTEFFTWTAPDLTITDILAPSSTEALHSFTITARVANSGSASAGTFTVAMAIDGEYWGQTTLSGLAANSSRDVSFSVPEGLSAGMHSIYFYADWGANIGESDETNNDLTEFFTWTGTPDLQLTDISPPSTTVGGQDFTITARITNIGNADADSFYVALVIDDGNYFDSQQVTTELPAGYYDTYVVFTVPGGLPSGPHSIQVVADYYNHISESNESNNSMTKSWTWTGIQAPTGVTAAPGPGSEQVTVSWIQPNNPYISHYKVYIGTASRNYSMIQDNISATSATWNSALISNLTNGVTHYFSVTAVDTSGAESAYSNEATAVPTGSGDLQPPSAPSNLAVLNPGTGTGLTLTWSPSTDDTGVDYYLIYRLTNNPSVSGYNYDSGFPRFSPSNTYTDTGLSGSNTYYYSVQAVDISGNPGALSSVVYGSPTDQVAPSAPPSIGISAENNTVYLWWSMPSTNTDGSTLIDLAGFNVYRGTTSGSYSPTPINGTILVTTTGFMDPTVANGQTYYYVVRAVDSEGNEGPSSYEVSGTPGGDLAPAAPSNLSITEMETSLDLAWSPNHEPDIAGYNVYRGSTTGDRSTRMNSNLLSTEWFSDDTASAGQTYYYVVTAVDSAGHESESSNEVSGMIGQGRLKIIAPTNEEPFVFDFSSEALIMSNLFSTHISPNTRTIQYEFTRKQRAFGVHLEITSSATKTIVYSSYEWDPLASGPYFTWNGRYKDKNECVPAGLYDTKVYVEETKIAGIKIVEYAEAIQPKSIQIKGCDRVTITTPPNNPNPTNITYKTNFSFLSDSTINAQATVIPRGSSSDITWSVTSAIGDITNKNPAEGKGESFSFQPAPPTPLPFKPGTDCDNSGNGSCAPSNPLSYRIRAEYSNIKEFLPAEHTITQDERDIIRQEYLNHGLADPDPKRTALKTPTSTTHYTEAQIRGRNSYTLVLGNPGNLAEAVRAAFNRLILDDVQVEGRGVGTTGLNRYDPIVTPGASIQEYGPLLNTPKCNGAPNPATCDDEIVNNNIVAGINGIAETVAVNQITDYDLTINSGWRNPERNEAFGGDPNSYHLRGNAVDIVHQNNVPNRSKNELNCILQTAADSIPNYDGFTEHKGTKRPDCRVDDITHVHVQPKQ